MEAEVLHPPEKPERQFVLQRVLDAPRESVFRAWTEPALLKHWWAPGDFTAPHCEVDLRVGGTVHACMRSPDGMDYWSVGEYREIVVPERLVLTDHFSDESGRVVAPEEYDMPPEWPVEALITVTFEARGTKTLLTVRHGVPLALAERTGAAEGWRMCLDKLGKFLAEGGDIAP